MLVGLLAIKVKHHFDDQLQRCTWPFLLVVFINVYFTQLLVSRGLVLINSASQAFLILFLAQIDEAGVGSLAV